MILCFILLLFFFRKPTRPSLPLRKAPPLISVFSPQGRRGKPPSGARNRYALWLADHQRSSPDFTGWDRLEMNGNRKYKKRDLCSYFEITLLQITIIKLVLSHFLNFISLLMANITLRKIS